MAMIRKEAPGEYQIGIYVVVRKQSRKWFAEAVGPGTVQNDGHWFRSLADAYLFITGEPLRPTEWGQSGRRT